MTRTTGHDVWITLQGVMVRLKAGSVIEASPETWARIEDKTPVREEPVAP